MSSRINKILSKINRVDETVMEKTPVDQTKVLKAYKQIYMNIQNLKSFSDNFSKVFSPPTEMVKGDVKKNIDKYLFMGTKDGYIKGKKNLFDINRDLEDIIDRLFDLERKIEVISDNMERATNL